MDYHKIRKALVGAQGALEDICDSVYNSEELPSHKALDVSGAESLHLKAASQLVTLERAIEDVTSPPTFTSVIADLCNAQDDLKQLALTDNQYYMLHKALDIVLDDIKSIERAHDES
jgi:hypothetical protein